MENHVPDSLSDRIATLKYRAVNSTSRIMHSQRKEIYGRVFAESREDSQVVRTAKALSTFLREKEIILWEEDLFAGYQQLYDFSVPYCPGLEAIQSSPSESASYELGQKGQRIGLFGGDLGGHVIAGYQYVLEKGFGGYADEARRRLQSQPDCDFAQASLMVCEAAREYALRYADSAIALAHKTGDDEYSRQQTRIAKACRRVATASARSFFEAIQLVWLTHEIITCEQRSGSLSLGRLDQYLYPYYARDIETGELSHAEARDLVPALWIKLAGLRKGFQHVVLGGPGSDGTYSANELTYLCLEATNALRMDQPLLSVRWRPDIPQRLWEAVQSLIRTGMGFPALFNDEVAIAAKRRLGISKQDAADYGVVGCVEVSIPGREFSHTEEIRVSWAKVLELMLNGGKCTVTGEQIDIGDQRDLDSIKSFDEFYSWYKDELRHFTNLGIRARNTRDAHYPDISPYPFLSSTMVGCLDSGLDVTAGGTIYNLSTVNGCGMANVVNSLLAVKTLVYERRCVSLSGLAALLRSESVLPDSLSAGLPKYGNDLPETDEIMRDLAGFFCDTVEGHTNPRGGRFQTGLYTVDGHASMGRLTGTLPDGRVGCTALASGFSPSQGTDLSGPTAVVNSTVRTDHALLGNGMVLDLKFAPDFFSNAEKASAFRHLVEAYFKMGGMEIQFNVIDRETLLAARESPAEYQDLIVRVSGFSAYFVDISAETQDEIIARTEHVGV
jgi:pyruvate formate-lyase/glycerol dehydratase family glycyl radical enzyme